MALTQAEKTELQILHRRIYGGDWGKPKSIPYALRRLDDMLFGYSLSQGYPEGVVFGTIGHRPVRAREIRRFVHLVCRILVDAAGRTEELTDTHWKALNRMHALGWQWISFKKDMKHWEDWWRIFRQVSRENLRTIPPLPRRLLGHALPTSWPEIQFLE